jgi:uncharacterized protein YyaL (SSP411 family)
MWGNGVMLRALVEGEKNDPGKYASLIHDYDKGLSEYWDPQGNPPGFEAYCTGPGGSDKYYDDNAWLVLAYIEAYLVTKERKFLDEAIATQEFVLSGWDSDSGAGGIFWRLKHETRNTCANAPAAVSALRLAALGVAGQHEWGVKIVNWTKANLRDSDGLYWDNIRADGSIDETKYTYNTALMILADVLLFQEDHDKAALADAELSADASLAKWQNAETGQCSDQACFSHLLCEALLRLYDADHEPKYLDAVRKYATFASTNGLDTVNGGYWGRWDSAEHPADEHKTILENASVARLYWMLVPYFPDSP